MKQEKWGFNCLGYLKEFLKLEKYQSREDKAMQSLYMSIVIPIYEMWYTKLHELLRDKTKSYNKIMKEGYKKKT